MSPSPSDRSPGRGRYSRHATPSERAREQRQRILTAACRLTIAQAPRAPTVDQIIDATGVGRNTFYGHFPGIPQLLERLKEDALDRLRAALDAGDDGPTPLAALRDFVHEWLATARRFDDDIRLVALLSRDALQVALCKRLSRVYETGARAGFFRSHLEPPLLRGAAALLLSLTLDGLEQPQGADTMVDVAERALGALLR